MTDFLQQMAESSEERAARVSHAFSASELDKPVLPVVLHGFDLIAEIKHSSPSAGALNLSGRSRSQQALSYVQGGAVAISVLTEPSRFSGTIAHLEEVTAIASPAGIPVMRKDFLVDPVQIVEARAAGASGVLLIAAMLSDKQLGSMLDCAWEHSMFVLLESFDASDLGRTASLLETDHHLRQAEQAKFFAGVNMRNLRTLQVDSKRLADLASNLPPQMVCVAESGLHDVADVVAAARQGYKMALVGTALMQSNDPQQLLSDLLVAGRNA